MIGLKCKGKEHKQVAGNNKFMLLLGVMILPITVTSLV